MLQRIKSRLACSSSQMMLATLIAAGTLAAAAPAAAQSEKAPTGSAPGGQTPPTATQTPAAATASGSSDAGGSAVKEIIVTARLRSENIQKVPESINYFSAKELQQQEIVSYQGLQGFSPNLQIETSYTGADPIVYIRNYPATIYFSEVPSLSPSAAYTISDASALYDISSVQVLEGPQGTLFGRSALGGAVLFTPTHPDLSAYQAGVDIMEGNLGLNNINGYVNIPIVQDHLALRIAAERQHTDGYTSMIGSSQKLDEINNESLRISLDWRPLGGRFENYTLLEYFDADQTPTSRIPSAYDPLETYYNSPPASTYAATCATSVADGYFSNVSACENQRLAVLAKVTASVKQGVAMERAGDVRTELADLYPSSPLISIDQNINLTDIANFDLLRWGTSDVYIRNIFSYFWYRDLTTTWTADNNFDYFAPGGDQAQLPLAGKPGVIGDGFGSPSLGPYDVTYSDEFQVHGDINSNLLTWVLGVYGAGLPEAPNPYSVDNLNLTYGGANTVAENPTYAGNYNMGYWSANWAEYFQATLDLRWLVKGLHVTAGVSDNQSYALSQTALVVYNYLTDTAHPGAMSAVVAKSTGLDWTFAVDYDITHDLMAYVTSRRAYVPGGINVQTSEVQGLPGYTPTYLPETLMDYEIGGKYTFSFGDAHGYIDLDAYRSDFSDIDVALSAYTVTGGFVSYTENAAAAIKEGIEFQTDVSPVPNLDINGTLAYAQDYYSQFYDSDPLSLVTHYQAGNPLCSSHSTSTTCILNLSNNPFSFAPSWMGSFRVRYDIPLGDNIGELVPSFDVNAQSKEWFSTIAAREIQAFGPQVAPGISQGGYAIVNARLEWDKLLGSKASAALFVNNLFNTLYARGGIDAMTGIGVANLNFAPPRIFGIELTDNF